jgi:pre-mycofactocin synthase
MNLKTMARFAPETLMRQRWLLDYAKTGRVPDLTVPNMAARGEAAPTLFGACGEWMRSPLPTWGDVRWLQGSGAGRS